MVRLKVQDEALNVEALEDEEDEPVFSIEEYETIVYNSCCASGGQTKEELERVCEWAREAKIMYATLQLVLNGELGAYMKDDELRFKSREHGDSKQEVDDAQAE